MDKELTYMNVALEEAKAAAARDEVVGEGKFYDFCGV